MIRRIARTLLLALGVVLVLFVVLESGVTGDPAERALGEHPTAERLGALRVELGFFRRFQTEALRVALEGPPARYFLSAEADRWLLLHDADGSARARLDLRELSLGQAAAALSAVELPEDRRLEARVSGDATRPAAGLAVALRGLRPALDHRRPAALPWAEARPAVLRFLRQCGRLVVFDFGRALDGQEIGATLRQRGLRSLALTLPALLLGTLFALAAALLALAIGGRVDRGLGWLAAAAIAISSLSWVLFLRALFAARLAWFPAAAWDPPSVGALALPVLIGAWLICWPDFQIYRALLRGERQRAHVLAARARGLAPSRVWSRHVVRSAAPGLIAHFVLALPFVVLGSMVLEQVFVIPGLGAWVVEAARAGDPAVLRAITFLVALLYLVTQEFGDWLAARIDPRLHRRAT